MKHEIPVLNWHMALPKIINDANDGDTIICRTEDQKELAQRAAGRMCPDKHLSFCVPPE